VVDGVYEVAIHASQSAALLSDIIRNYFLQYAADVFLSNLLLGSCDKNPLTQPRRRVNIVGGYSRFEVVSASSQARENEELQRGGCLFLTGGRDKQSTKIEGANHSLHHSDHKGRNSRNQVIVLQIFVGKEYSGMSGNFVIHSSDVATLPSISSGDRQDYETMPVMMAF
jgi:hypothetical protein